jgi:hypothetical protein
MFVAQVTVRFTSAPAVVPVGAVTVQVCHGLLGGVSTVSL